MAGSNDILVLLEPGEPVGSPINAELLGAGRALADALGGRLTAALAGTDAVTGAADAGAYGADTVLALDAPQLGEYVGDVYVQAFERAIQRANPGVVLVGHTVSGRELGPRLAYRIGGGITTDATHPRVEGGQVVITKPVYGGNAVAEYVHSSSVQFATLRPRAFPAAEQ